MDDLSFIIPIRVDSDDRINKCVTILRFITRYFPAAEIQLREQDMVSELARSLPRFARSSMRSSAELGALIISPGLFASHKPVVPT